MSSRNAADVQAAFCAVLADEWARAGVTEAVVAPGSRSTPLVLALDAEPRIRVHVVLDERSAGFVALGLGQAARRPAVVATTSGTASVELHPAIVEASYAGVPLIAATADRPPELHQVAAPQTIDQEGLFGGVVRWACSPGVAELSSAASWRSLASRCVAETSGRAPGPVHINLAFREPLVGSADDLDIPSGRPGGAPWHDSAGWLAGAAPDDLVDLLGSHAGARGLIVAGAGAGDPSSLLAAADRLGWPVLADPRSGCRTADRPVVAAADALLRVPSVAGWRPDVVLRVGAPWSSKVVNQWLGALPSDVPQVLVDPQQAWRDPERTASHVLATDPEVLMSAVVGCLPPDSGGKSDWYGSWLAAESAAREVFEANLGAGALHSLSEPAVARAALAGLPDGGQLVVSSSMPVRDVEWYGAPRSGIHVLANRGVNGIDGVLSTAIGVALAHGRPTLALMGDLAFVYDAGAMVWIATREVALTVVVVDNDGGGIFSFLPQASKLESPVFERYWGTPHGLDLGALARAYGVDVLPVGGRSQLDALVSDAAKPGVRVGIVRSNRATNVETHELLHASVAAAIEGL
jgi:2-succinyl-5-enolpyruvyl-6-hydroxy-3-cyclohexene-1-carboxylate synthase